MKIKSEKQTKERTYSRYLKDNKTVRRISEWGKVLAQLTSPEGKPEAIDDITIVDCSFACLPAFIASSFLAEFGAEVIKAEPPQGDPARFITPYGVTVGGVGLPFLMESRNKRFIQLDINEEQDRQVFKRLTTKVDVVIESFPPGYLDSRGIGYRQLKELNPRLIYTAITPYGQYTARAKEFSNVPWSELTSQAESGLCAIVGDLPDMPEPYSWPTRVGFYATAYITGVAAALAILVALFYRRRSGEGQMIDLATADAFASCVGIPVTMGYVWKRPRMRYGTLDYGLCPYGFYKCKDGYVAVACFRDQDFRAALKILKRWDLEEDWRSLLDRITDDVEKAKELDEEIAKTVAEYTCDEIIKKFSDYSAKAARSRWSGGGLPVTTKLLTPKDVMAEEHWKVRGNLLLIDNPSLGKFIVPVAGKMSETPPRVKWISPEIGRDDQYVRQKYKLNED